MRDHELNPSRANPLGRQWHELDMMARTEVLKEWLERLGGVDSNARVNSVNQGLQSSEPLDWNRRNSVNQAADKPATLNQGIAAAGAGDPGIQEAQARDLLTRYVDDFMQLPTPANMELLVFQTHAYQATWMKGRKRVEIKG